MIKVCHMTSAHQPGDTRIFQKECVSLAKAGYQVFLVQRGELRCPDHRCGTALRRAAYPDDLLCPQSV